MVVDEGGNLSTLVHQLLWLAIVEEVVVVMDIIFMALDDGYQ